MSELQHLFTEAAKEVETQLVRSLTLHFIPVLG